MLCVVFLKCSCSLFSLLLLFYYLFQLFPSFLLSTLSTLSLFLSSYVDSTKKANISRYMNHCCEPNSFVELWKCGAEWRAAFFTQKIVRKGEELTFDYHWEALGETSLIQCQCGTKKCHGFVDYVKHPAGWSSQSTLDAEKQSDEFRQEDLETDHQTLRNDPFLNHLLMSTKKKSGSSRSSPVNSLVTEVVANSDASFSGLPSSSSVLEPVSRLFEHIKEPIKRRSQYLQLIGIGKELQAGQDFSIEGLKQYFKSMGHVQKVAKCWICSDNKVQPDVNEANSVMFKFNSVDDASELYTVLKNKCREIKQPFKPEHLTGKWWVEEKTDSGTEWTKEFKNEIVLKKTSLPVSTLTFPFTLDWYKTLNLADRQEFELTDRQRMDLLETHLKRYARKSRLALGSRCESAVCSASIVVQRYFCAVRKVDELSKYDQRACVAAALLASCKYLGLLTSREEARKARGKGGNRKGAETKMTAERLARTLASIMAEDARSDGNGTMSMEERIKAARNAGDDDDVLNAMLLQNSGSPMDESDDDSDSDGGDSESSSASTSSSSSTSTSSVEANGVNFHELLVRWERAVLEGVCFDLPGSDPDVRDIRTMMKTQVPILLKRNNSARDHKHVLTCSQRLMYNTCDDKLWINHSSAEAVAGSVVVAVTLLLHRGRMLERQEDENVVPSWYVFLFSFFCDKNIFFFSEHLRP